MPSEQQSQRILERYQEQIQKKRMEAGQHPVSGFAIEPSKQCRIGCRFEFFHQPPSGQPTVCNTIFMRWLESSEQAFQRHLHLGENWVPLEHGWIPPDQVGMLTLKNNEGAFQVVPTPEERQEVMSRIIEIGHRQTGSNGDTFTTLHQIRPGECCQFEPLNADLLSVRCRHGKARATLFLVPR